MNIEKMNLIPKNVIDLAVTYLSHPDINTRQNSRLTIENIKNFCIEVLSDKYETDYKNNQNYRTIQSKGGSKRP